MLDALIAFSVRHRWLVLFAVVALAGLGIWNSQRLAIDAVPDITNTQVQINTSAPGLSPLEVEQRITYPLETAMAGIPGLDHTRSLSRYGLSQITVIFKDGTDIYFGRQLINERIQEAREHLPAGVSAEMGPISTGLGEIYMWTIHADKDARTPEGKPYDLTELRTLQDWVIKPQLRTVPGVVEINTTGGYTKEYHVTPHPDKLAAYGLSFRDILDTLAKNNANLGAGYIERHGEQYLIRASGQLTSLNDIRKLVVSRSNGTPGIPLPLDAVADVIIGEELRTGAATANGEETVLGTTFMLMGENSRAVSARVHEKMKEVNRSLPKGVEVRTVYDRTTLVDATLATVKKNLFEGAILVIVILFALLGNIRAALITALIIPLSMLFTLSGMVANHVTGNLMSLGAIDFGIIVDGAVIIVENCIRRLADAQKEHGRLLSRPERFDIVRHATREVMTPSLFGTLIIMVVYLPLLTLSGVEGKMFTPMAFSVLTALLGALILSLTFIPAAIATFMSGRVTETEPAPIRLFKRLYTKALDITLRNRSVVTTASIALVILCGLLASRMGREFIPSLDEGDLALQAMRIPGTSLTQSVEMQKQLERKLLGLPEVKEVFARIGTSEVASDPMPPSVADSYIMLKPRKEWPNPAMSKAEIMEKVTDAVAEVPGNNYEISQPIELRFNELISGIRSDVGIKIMGDDLDLLLKSGNKVAEVLGKVPGATDVKVEQTSGLPVLTIDIDREALARYNLNIEEVHEILELAIGGKTAGQIFEGDRRFDLKVRLPEILRTDLEQLRRLPIPLGEGSGEESGTRPTIPLQAVARLDLATGPNQISRENGKRLIVVSCNIRNRDIGSFVSEAQAAITEKAPLPSGYWAVWGGEFEQMQSATKRLEIVVPLALLLIFVLLFIAFGSVRDALLVYTGIPLALTGGIIALWLRDIPLSISAGVGFIALSGVAVLNGVVMVSFINELRKKGRSLEAAIREGSLTRLRPVLMTALVASLGFIPMALAHGRGAEVQRPLATVVIGGIISSTLLTLLVLPSIYRIVHRKEAEEEVKEGRITPPPAASLPLA